MSDYIYLKLDQKGTSPNGQIKNILRFYLLKTTLQKSDWSVCDRFIHDAGVAEAVVDFSILPTRVEKNSQIPPGEKPAYKKLFASMANIDFSYTVSRVNGNLPTQPISDEEIIIKPISLENRKTHGFNWTEEQEFNAQLKYGLIDMIFYGDQWTLRTDEEMADFAKKGFKIECFGSPFNTRLQYFGSMFADDHVFGGLGDCVSILQTLIKNGELKHGNKTVIGKNAVIKLILSPSTYVELVNKIMGLLKILFKKRKCIVHIGLFQLHHELFQKRHYINPDYKYMYTKTKNSFKVFKYCYSYHQEQNAPIRSDWYDYQFAN